MPKFISPIEAKQMAEKLMLGGAEAVTLTDWEKVVNCWAANFPKDLAEVETLLVAKIMECPLPEDTVKQIVEYQLARR